MKAGEALRTVQLQLKVSRLMKRSRWYQKAGHNAQIREHNLQGAVEVFTRLKQFSVHMNAMI